MEDIEENITNGSRANTIKPEQGFPLICFGLVP